MWVGVGGCGRVWVWVCGCVGECCVWACRGVGEWG